MTTAPQASTAPAQPPPAAAAPAGPDPFDDLLPRRRFGWLWLLLLVAVGAGGGYWYYKKTRRPAAPQFLTARISRGDVLEKIESTGTVQPLLQVQVSSQVSGRILRVHVDFNARVRQGQLLAELDTAPFEAAVAAARAAVSSAQAQLARARVEVTLQERNLARAQDLRARGLNAPAEVEAAQSARDAARAQIAVVQADIARTRAQLESSQTNLRYARIYAPVDGIVITRSAEPGQTVAASLQAPVLFVIANDLTRMQILADIDEADVGRLHDGMTVEARVEAYPNDRFRGTVRELRFAPTTTAGVVTYPAVIDVANPEVKLRPGMTATVSVVTNERTDVLRAPNAALRFRPASASGERSERRGGRGGRGAGAEGGEPSAARASGAPSAGGPSAGGPSAGGREGGERMQRLYVVRDGQAVPLRVRTGPTDGTYTEVSGEGVTEDLEVITEQLDASGPSAGGASAGGARQPGMPAGGRTGGGRGARFF